MAAPRWNLPPGKARPFPLDPFVDLLHPIVLVGRLEPWAHTLTLHSVAKVNPKPDPAAIAACDVTLTWEDGRLIDPESSEVKMVPSRG